MRRAWRAPLQLPTMLSGVGQIPGTGGKLAGNRRERFGVRDIGAEEADVRRERACEGFKGAVGAVPAVQTEECEGAGSVAFNVHVPRSFGRSFCR